MSNDEVTYYERRAAEEDAAATRAGNGAVAHAHRELSRRYRAVAEGKLSLSRLRKKRWLGGGGR